MFVDYAPDHPSLCFWVERVDGVATDFGVPSCLQGIGVLNRQSFRQFVRTVIENFKQCRIGTSATFVSDFSRAVSKIEARLSYVDDKTLLYLAEVLKVPVQDLFPPRTSGNRIHDFMEKLETTRF